MNLNELCWLIAGQIGLLLIVAGGIWTAASNHDDGKPQLNAVVIWIIWIHIVVAAGLFTHPFQTEIAPDLPPIGHGFRFVAGLAYIAYPLTRRFSSRIAMSVRFERSLTLVVSLFAVGTLLMAGYFGAVSYRSGDFDGDYLTAQAKRNARMLQRDTTLTAGMTRQIDSLTKLTHRQAGEVATLTDEVRGLNRQVQESNGLIIALLRKLNALQAMITRLLGKPSQSVQSIGVGAKADATLDPRRIYPLPPVPH